MPSRSQRQRRDTSNVVGAGAAGGSIGTIVAAIASAMPPGSMWKVALTVSAPLLAVLVSGLGQFVNSVYLDPFFRSRKAKAAATAMDEILDNARSSKLKVMNDPHASEDHKRAMTRQVEQLEEVRFRKVLKHMEILALEEH